jgi:hypothetical protein
MRRGLLAFIGATALVALQCVSPTEVVVAVRSEACTRAGAPTLVSVSVAGDLSQLAQGQNRSSTSARSCLESNGSVGTFVVRPHEGSDGLVAFAVATSVAPGVSADDCLAGNASDACIVARRQLRFAPHASVHLVVDLRLSCRGVVCAPDSTCENAGCVSAVLSDGCTTPGECGGALGDGDAGGGTPDAAAIDAMVPVTKDAGATIDAASADSGVVACVPGAVACGGDGCCPLGLFCCSDPMGNAPHCISDSAACTGPAFQCTGSDDCGATYCCLTPSTPAGISGPSVAVCSATCASTLVCTSNSDRACMDSCGRGIGGTVGPLSLCQ